MDRGSLMIIAKADSASLDMEDADVALYRGFLQTADADRLFASLTANLDWRQKQIRMFGKWVTMPRLTAWYGDPDANYTYSGLTETPLPWTVELLEIRGHLTLTTGFTFNSVLANLYRDGADSMGWHSDDERELGPKPVIASVSLGACRRFVFRHRTRPERTIALELPHGSLLLMAGNTQRFWKHQLPKSTTVSAPRINLTYRTIVPIP